MLLNLIVRELELGLMFCQIGNIEGIVISLSYCSWITNIRLLCFSILDSHKFLNKFGFWGGICVLNHRHFATFEFFDVRFEIINIVWNSEVTMQIMKYFLSFIPHRPPARGEYKTRTLVHGPLRGPDPGPWTPPFTRPGSMAPYFYCPEKYWSKQ